jgi:hypothetical protein
VKISEDSSARGVYLAKWHGASVKVMIGPAFDRISTGLSQDEELGRYSKTYFGNHLWEENGSTSTKTKPGSIVELGSYPALITPFSSSGHIAMTGSVAAVLTPWGKIIPVSCVYQSSDSSTLEGVCEQVLNSVRLRRD